MLQFDDLLREIITDTADTVTIAIILYLENGSKTKHLHVCLFFECGHDPKQ